MDRRKYSDAEKAEYWKAKALAAGAKGEYRGAQKSSKGMKHRYAYKTAKMQNAAEQARYRRESTRDPGVISAVGGGLGGLAGTALGGPLGEALGTMIGGKLGHLVEKITGFGDYRVVSNTLMKGGMTPAQVVNSSERGGVIVRHREFIKDIVATADFTIEKFPINPGQVKTFPWLASSSGPAYDQYKMRGMIVEFKSTSSDAVLSSSASTGLGSVMIATDYDALDAPYPNKRAMLNSEFACSSKPSCSFIHPIECKSSVTPAHMQYVRTTPGFPAGGDPRWYDLGNFYVATEGMQNSESTSVIGELWVSYEVELYKPQLSPIGDDDYPSDIFKLSGQTSSTWLANAVPNTENTLGGTTDSGTYYFPTSVDDGKYLVTYYASGTTAVIGEVSTLLTNCAYVDVYRSVATNFLQSPGTGTNSASLMCEFVVQVSGPNAAVGFMTAALPTGTPIGYLIVTVISDSFAPV